MDDHPEANLKVNHSPLLRRSTELYVSPLWRCASSNKLHGLFIVTHTIPCDGVEKHITETVFVTLYLATGISESLEKIHCFLEANTMMWEARPLPHVRISPMLLSVTMEQDALDWYCVLCMAWSPSSSYLTSVCTVSRLHWGGGAERELNHLLAQEHAKFRGNVEVDHLRRKRSNSTRCNPSPISMDAWRIIPQDGVLLNMHFLGLIFFSKAWNPIL